MKKAIMVIFGMAILAILLSMTTCSNTDAEVASYNLSKSADQFEVFRRVVFYNGITDEYILMVEGYCSITVDIAASQLELTVKTEEGLFMKHFLGLSDNVTYFVEQIDPKKVSTGQYRVIFKPSTIIPAVEMR
jgi:hypothetical protein